ncbi:hypothetical protein [Rhodospirillum rubrum]|uniref:hypothetical protein n=1 Tax=Rhodospirillum rubrum TaxID=1085 RepID=UPI001904AC8C|nr:hypothetical protein [Rhodospirillum rubrum]
MKKGVRPLFGPFYSQSRQVADLSIERVGLFMEHGARQVWRAGFAKHPRNLVDIEDISR